MTPRVTVLLPVYNGGELVRGAIESVLAQTYPDFELLVVDDGSSDGSAEVLGSYGDERIRVLRNEENRGQVRSLNRGLGEARGAYVARLDQDDVCMPRRLERQVAALDREPGVAVVGTWMDLYDDEGRLAWELRGTIDDSAEFTFLILTNRLPLAHPTVMFRLAPVRELGGYDPSVRYAEDQDLWRRLALAGYEARVLREPLLRYRIHAEQQSQRNWQEQQANNNRALERFIAELGGDVDARRLRLLLAWDDSFWDSTGTPAAASETARHLAVLLATIVGRLGLGPEQAAKLERLMRRRVAIAARRSWRSGVVRHWRAAPPLLRFGLRGAPPSGYLAAVLVYATAPVLPVLRGAEQLVESTWQRAWLAPVKRRTRRLRVARNLLRMATRGRRTQ